MQGKTDGEETSLAHARSNLAFLLVLILINFLFTINRNDILAWDFSLNLTLFLFNF